MKAAPWPGTSSTATDAGHAIIRVCFELADRNYMTGKHVPDTLGLGTRAIHAGQEPDPSTGANMTPIYATSTYVQSSPGKHQGYEYSRSQNPTRMAWERCVADLEGDVAGFAFGSGLAAASTVLDLLDAGSHVIAMEDLYGGSYRLFEKVRRRSAGLDFSYRSEEHTSELQSRGHLVCRLLLEKKKNNINIYFKNRNKKLALLAK